MNYSIFRFTLNMHNHRSQASVSAFHGDTAIRLCITLTDGGNTYTIKEGCTAVLSGTKADGTKIWHRCVIVGDTIQYDFRPQTTSCVGIVNCEISLYGSSGDLLTAPKFSIVVDEKEVRDEDIIESRADVQDAIDALFAVEANVSELAEKSVVIADSVEEKADNAKASADEALQSADTAQGMALQAQVSAKKAMESETNARTQVTYAMDAERNARLFANNSQNSATIAQESAVIAQTSATSAETSADEALVSATKAAEEVETIRNIAEGFATKDEVSNLREVAEGKTKNYVYPTERSMVNWLNANKSTDAFGGYFYTFAPNEVTIRGEKLKTGDVILIAEPNSPDWWYDGSEEYDGIGYLYQLETRKIDLTSYLEKDTSTSERKKVYAKLESGTNSMLECSTGRSAGTIALRNPTSLNFGVGEPTSDVECVPRGYADNRYVKKDDVFESRVQEKVCRPIASDAVYNAIAGATFDINGKVLEAGATLDLAQYAYGEYTIYGSDVTVDYKLNSAMTPKSYTGKLHQLTIYSTKLDNGATQPQILHVVAGASSLGIPSYDTAFGTLKTAVTITANQKAFVVIKRARSGVNVDELIVSDFDASGTPMIPI